MQRLLDPRWEAMAFFGGSRTARPKGGLSDIAGWQTMAPTDAANAVQQSNHPDFYAQWEVPATDLRQHQSGCPRHRPALGARRRPRRTVLHQHPDRPARGEAGPKPVRNIGCRDDPGHRDQGVRLGDRSGRDQWTWSDPLLRSGPFGTAAYGTGLANKPRDGRRIARSTWSGNMGSDHPALDRTRAAHRSAPTRSTSVAGSTIRRSVVSPVVEDTRDPIGSVDGASSGIGRDQIDVGAGPPTRHHRAAREEVHIYVTGPNGTSGTPGTFTGDSRPDVGAAYSAGPGSAAGSTDRCRRWATANNQVCVFAINVKPPIHQPESSAAARSPLP